MRRFFIEPSEISKERPAIEGRDAHHISAVFRLKPGDAILLVDGTGYEYQARIITSSKNLVTVAVVEKTAVQTESPVRVNVGQGYLKDKKMDMLVRHLTELGIARWTPVLTEYSVPQPATKKDSTRMERWQTIAREAVKQCGRSRPPAIGAPVSLHDWMRDAHDQGLKIVFYEDEPLPLTRIAAAVSAPPRDIQVIFGPEGGFSGKEIDLAKSNGFVTASLGPRILRAETAAIAACALLQHIFGDMG